MKFQNIKNLFIVDVLPECKAQFKKEHLNLSLTRIKILCTAILVLSLYFLYSDIKIYNSVDSNIVFKNTLIIYHLNSFILSSLYLIMYKKIKNNSNSRTAIIISYIYILILLISGTITSLNSQRFTGNIDAYIIFTIIASITFTYNPTFMITSLTLNHLILMIGLNLLCHNYFSLVSKQINATTVFIFSISLVLYLHKFRVIEFNNNCKIAKSEANFKKLFRVNPNPLILSKYEDGQILFANQRAHEFYGYDEVEFHNMSFVNLYIDVNDRIKMTTELSRLGMIRNYIIEQKLKSGLTKWVIANYELLKYNDQDCIITSITDITEMKKMENELSSHASIDALTGILNRRKGIEILEKLFEVSQNSFSPLVICFVDVDGLKLVNDNYGHADGDYLLRTISDLIKKSIRNTDVFFRYGGDEFVILFPDTNTYIVENIWHRVKLELDELNYKKVKPYNISASHGMFEYNGQMNLSIDEILDIADKNMYKEKMRKRDLKIRDKI